MKQRLLLALLMVFASVGLIGAQGTGPSSNAVPINITIPAGNGEVIIQVKSDKGLSAAPNLFKSDNKKLTATGGSNTLPWAYTIDQTNSEQKVFFENGSGGSTTDWEGLEMTISGPVSSFEISGDNGVIAESLTSLSFVNNGVLETLILGPTTAGNQGNIGYVSKLKTLECSGNKLSVIPVCKNGSTITIDNYNVGTQNSTLSISMDATGTTEHTVMVNEESLKKMFPHLDDNGYTLDFTDVTVTGDATSGYTFTQNGAHVGGNFTATLRMASTNSRYPNVVIPNVKVTVPEPEFLLSKPTTNNCEPTYTLNDESVSFGTSNSLELKKDDKLVVTINPTSGYELSSLSTEGLLIDPNNTDKEKGVYAFTVKGDKNPTMTITCAKPEAEKAMITLSANGGGEAKVVNDENNSIVGQSFESNTEITIKAKANEGYYVEKVTFNGGEQTLSNAPASSDGFYYVKVMTDATKTVNHTEVFFAQGATIEKKAVNATISNLKVDDATYAEGTTYKAGQTVTFTATTSTNYQIVKVWVNGEAAKLSGSTYSFETVTGVNRIEVVTESTAATLTYHYIGLSREDVDLTSTNNLKAGDDISVSLKAEHAASVAGIEKVVFNGVEDRDAPFTAKAVSGSNTVIIYAKTTATLQIAVTPNEQGSAVVVEDASGNTLTNGASLANIDKVNITITTPTGYNLMAATFNGTALTAGENKDVDVKKNQLNQLVVVFQEKAATTVNTTPVIKDNEGGTANISYKTGWSNAVVTVSPKTGYGLNDILVNGKEVAWETTSVANQYRVPVEANQANTITVVFSTLSTISYEVSIADGITQPTLTIEYDVDGTWTKAESTNNLTLKPGTKIRITAPEVDGMEVSSITLNGKALETTVDATGATMTKGGDVLLVGNNHIVVAYGDQRVTGIKVKTIGREALQNTEFNYQNAEGNPVTVTNLKAGDNVYIQLTPKSGIVSSVYLNDEKLNLKENSNDIYVGTVQAGQNTLYVFFDAQALVKTAFDTESGVSSVSVTDAKGTPINESTELDPETEITIAPTAADGYVIDKVYFNGVAQTLSSGKVDVKVISGLNTIVVTASKNPTIAKTIIGEGTGSLDADDLISVTTQNLTVGSSVEFTVTETSGDFQVKAVYFNGVKVEPQGGEYAGTIAAGTNYITVEYVSTAIGNIKVNVIAEEGGKATYKLNEKNRTVTVTTTPNSGYGVESVVANGGNSQVITKTANKTYTFTAQPGDNTVQVYFTQQALVSAQVLGAESSAEDIAVKNGNNPVSLIGSASPTTLEIGTPITITVNSEKEGYQLASVTVNGKVQTGSASENGMTYTYGVDVGENHIVATYESTKATEVKEIVVGGKAEVKYYKESTEITDFTTLTDGTAIDIEIKAEEPNTFRTAYFNNEMLEDENEDSKYEAEVRKGENTLYVFLNDAAAIVANESENGTVKFTQSGAEVGIDAKLNEGSNVNVSIEPVEGYEIARVYYNGQLVTDLTDGEFTAKVQSGLNVVHVEYNQIPTINLEYDKNAGTVTYTPNKNLTTGKEVIFIVKPNESTGFLFAQFYHNGKLISDDNEDGKYEITLVAGENNVYVKFSAEVEGHMLVKYDEQTTETTTKVTNVVISELKGDKTWSPDNGEYIDVPAATLLKVTFQVPDIKNGNVDGIVSAVINGQNYAPLTADEDGVYTIGQADLANDRIVLPEGESVLRIYVKTRKGITITPTLDGYVYDGNEKAIEFTTKPASIKNDPNLKISYAYDGSDEWTVTPLEAGDYRVRFEREADDQYSAYRKDFKFTVAKAQLVVTQLPEVTLEQPGTNGSPLVVSGGTVGYWSNGSYVTINGTFSTTNTHDKGDHSAEVTFTPDEYDDNLDYSLVSNYITVNYKPNNQTNYYSITTDASEVPTFRLVKAGNIVVNSMDYLEGTDAIAMAYDVVPGYKYTLYQVDENGDETPVVDPEDGFTVAEVCNNDAPNATLVLRAEELPRLGVTGTTDNVFEIKTKPVYDSYPHPFKPTKDNLPLMYGENNKRVKDQAVYDKLVVTYTDANGNMIIEPVNAGTYTVTVSYAADDKYQDFTATAEYTIEKRKLDDLYIKDPVASPLAAGLTLENSTLLGAAEIPGNYKWEDPTNVPTADDDGGVNQHAYFQPIDTQNFGNHRDVGTVRVRILEGVQVVSAHSNYGKVLVKDQTGTALNMPASVAPGTKLTVSAVNTDPTLLELESIAVTMIVDGKETTTTIADGSTITFPEEGNVEIEATFKLKDNSSTIVVPDGQRAVVMPKSVRGAKLSKTGVHTVDYGESFTFTVSTLEADKDKVVVSVNGTTIQPANGVYTISNITEQQNVSVSLTSKTEVKVDIQKEYKLKDGTLIGRVTVVNNTSNDGKFYYNDELTLVAEPVKGVTFSAWSDGNKEDVRKYAIASSEVKLTASFSGVPTGIEDIESAQILAGNECIWVKNVADANVTIVGMTGRIQAQQQISGDTQIRVPAGIYVVVLENGKDVKQVKVIVR